MGDLGEMNLYEESWSQRMLEECGNLNYCHSRTAFLHDPLLPDPREAQPPYCNCQGLATCCRCCWAFPVEGGIWMNDWEAPLHLAAAAAQAAEVRDILEASHAQPSRQEAARLLDVAILTGNDQAAASFAQTYPARPLRRWRADELAQQGPVLLAALRAGADFEGLHVDCGSVTLPLLRFCALLGNWQEFLPAESWPSHEVWVGELFLSDWPWDENGELLHSLCMQKLQNAKSGGWALKYICTGLVDEENHHRASLLDLAILCGQSDCAESLADAGVELDPSCLALHKRVHHGDVPGKLRAAGGLLLHMASPKQHRCAAMAAARVQRVALELTGLPIPLQGEIMAFSTVGPLELAESSVAGS